MANQIDKFALKEMLYHIYDTIDAEAGKVNSPACYDAETGNLRAKAMNELRKAAEEIRGIASSIY